MGHIQNLEDLVNFLLRRRWVILAVTVIGIALSAVIAKSRPDTYEAAAVIEVQAAQVGTGQTDGSAQLFQSIEQRLTTREMLLAVIERHGLYRDLAALSTDERATLLRTNVTFTPIAAAGASPYATASQISAIIIAARDGDPELAARIANDFAQSVLDMSTSGQLEQARETVAFYREEEARISGQIDDIEAKLAEFKSKNHSALPGVADAARDELVAVESEIRSLEQALVALMEEQRQLTEKGELRATEQRRLQELDARLGVLVEQKSALADRRTELSTAIARVPEVEQALAGFQREIDQLQNSLDTVLEDLAKAETSARLAERNQAERFALLERAQRPEYAIGSGGKKLFIAGAMASVFAAVALAFLLDMLKPVVRTSAQLERQLGLRPIVAIPELDFAARSPRRRA